jgi:selenide,water dikinase
MGGRPLTALAAACCPDRPEELEILAEIMVGGEETLRRAGVSLLGGHSVCDAEIKFGYAVTGLVHPDRIVTNAGARPGDALVLTKPLGMGIVATAIKRALAAPETVAEAVGIMTALNRDASEVMLRFRCHAATDVTGFGLLGHGLEIAEASRVTLRFQASAVPYVPAAWPLAEARVLPGLIAKTWRLLEPRSFVHPSVPEPLRSILLDPQTSGGLLLAVDPDDLGPLLAEMAHRGVQAAHVGRVEPAGELRIVVD